MLSLLVLPSWCRTEKYVLRMKNGDDAKSEDVFAIFYHRTFPTRPPGLYSFVLKMIGIRKRRPSLHALREVLLFDPVKELLQGQSKNWRIIITNKCQKLSSKIMIDSTATIIEVRSNLRTVAAKKLGSRAFFSNNLKCVALSVLPRLHSAFRSAS